MKTIKFLLLIILLYSCGFASMQDKSVITKIIVDKDGQSAYFGPGRTNSGGTLDFCFFDSTGKFNIGDTVKFIK